MQYNIERVAGAGGCPAVVAELSHKLSDFIPEKKYFADRNFSIYGSLKVNHVNIVFLHV